MNMNMSECEQVDILLAKRECPQRKKRAYNSVALQELREEQQQHYGERVERNVIKAPLPEVGTFIKMTEVIKFVRVHAWDKPSEQGYILAPFPREPRSSVSMAGLIVSDEEKVYEVLGYTGDTSNPYRSSLKMRFRCVHPAVRYAPERSVPTRLIACGHIRYTEISPKELMQLSLHAEKDVDEN